MSVSFDEVRRIARLARVGVEDSRLAALAAELSGILAHMAVLSRVDVSGAVRNEEEGGIVMGTPLREDHGPPVPLHRTLADLAPEMRDGFFIVPRLTTHAAPADNEAGVPLTTSDP